MSASDANRHNPGALVRLTGRRGTGDTYIVLARYSDDEYHDEYRLKNKRTGAIVRAEAFELSRLEK